MADGFRRRSDSRQLDSRWLWPLLLAVFWILLRAAALAQAVQPDTSVSAALRNLASRSGVAFVGRVTKIDYGPGVVAVVFQVEQPLVGAVGSTYTLREWAGLWAAGQHRYSVGQRVAIFLHAPGKSGLSSPVDGMEGIVPVVQESANSEPLLDVRRVAARVQRNVGEPISDASNGAMKLADAADVVAGWNGTPRPEPIRRPLPIGFAPIVTTPIVTTPIITTPIVKAPIEIMKPIDLPVWKVR